MQGLHIAVQAMAAAGAERVGLAQAGSNNLVELTGTPEENKERLSSFLNNMMERGEHASVVRYQCRAGTSASWSAQIRPRTKR